MPGNEKCLLKANPAVHGYKQVIQSGRMHKHLINDVICHVCCRICAIYSVTI